MSSTNLEEKVETALEEEKTEDVEPISYVSQEEETPANIEENIAEAFNDAGEDDTDDDETEPELDDETDGEELVETPMSSAARNLETGLTVEIINRVENNDTEETLACSVCYTALSKDNIVNTPCNHSYCWECFFKWIHTAPTCPMCRKNFISENAWYENRDVENDRDDLRELVNIYQRELVGLSREFKHVNMEIRQADIRLNKIKKENNDNLTRLISSRELISYNEGYIAGQRDVSNNMFKEKYIKQQSKFNTPWFQGYSKAQWELRFTDRISSGNREPRVKKYSEIDREEIKEFNKHNMGFKIKEKAEETDEEEITKEKSKNKQKKILELAANTPLPDDSEGEEKNGEFDYTGIL